MRDLTRFVQISILAGVFFVMLLAWWGVAVYGSPLAWFAVATLLLLFSALATLVAVDAVQDAQIKNAAYRQEMGKARLIYADGRWWEWEDADGDGQVDAGELHESFPIYDKEHPKSGPDPIAAEAQAQQLRALLIWCYRRQEKGESFDQKPGRKQFKGFYDDGMAELARRGFLRARSTGHRGDLARATLAEALEDFDNGGEK